MKFKFNISDRVRVLNGSRIRDYTGGWCMKDTVGKEGIITDRIVIKGRPCYSIRFDDRGMDLYKNCVFDERCLDFITFDTNFSIVGKVVGRKVYLRMCNSNGEIVTSEARCHPDDEFDLKTGINIAIDRLFKLSLYNGKVVCIESDPVKFPFTKGKIYTIANGEIKDNYGITSLKNIRSLDEFDEVKGLSFIPLVE